MLGITEHRTPHFGVDKMRDQMKMMQDEDGDVRAGTPIIVPFLPSEAKHHWNAAVG
jgi:hypothetical protein